MDTITSATSILSPSVLKRSLETRSIARKSFTTAGQFSVTCPKALFSTKTVSESRNSKGKLRIACAAAAEISEVPPVDLGSGKELTETEKFALSIPAALKNILAFVVVAGAAGAGFVAGRKVNADIGPLAGAVVLGAAGGGAVAVLSNAERDGAAKEVFNAIVLHPNPNALGKPDIAAVSEIYGMKLDDERLIDELRELYDRYVSNIMPQGNDPLLGHEVDSISQFKSALHLDDDIAAGVHIELGRRIIRQRMEAGTKESNVAERKSFQKLVYVSNLVFGEKSKFLLPWKRVFKVTDSQVEVAILDNAKRLLEAAIDESKADADLSKLKKLRQLQLKYRVPDDVAEELFIEKSRARLEVIMDKAVELAKARIKDIPQVVGLLKQAIEYSVSMGVLSKESDILPGVAAVTVSGGKYDGSREIGELKMLYGTFLEDSLAGGALEDKSVDVLSQLRILFGLGNKEAEAVEVEITSKVYRRQLSQAVKTGALEAAESKASYLEDLCENLNFDPEEAFKIHQDIYRQKLELCLKDNSLTDEDVKSLQKLRVLLCIPQEVVDTVHGSICGKIFEKVLDDAMSAGVGGYDPLLQDSVQKAVKGLRLPYEAAMDVTSRKVKATFLSFVKRAKGTMDRVAAGRELKKLVMFSNLTVSQIIDDIKTASGVAIEAVPEPIVPEKKELSPDLSNRAERIARMEKIYEEEFGGGQSMRKFKQRKPVRDGKPQTEINLREELDLLERQELYEKFLAYAVQGEEVEVSYGLKIAVQRDEKDFVRLQQLGQLLGLTPLETNAVTQRLSEKAFKQQAESLLADGQLNQRRVEQLKEIQKQVGLPDEPAQKIIKSITTGKVAGSIARAIQQGKLKIEDIQGLREAGFEIESLVAKPARVQMLRQLISDLLNAGTGEFDNELVTEKYPVDLSIPAEEVKGMLTNAANEKVKDSLVQAVSMLRQKQIAKVISQLNNIVSAARASPQSEPLSWAVKDELLDLYALYITKVSPDDAKEGLLRSVLGIDEATAANLKSIVARGGFNLETKEEEDFVF